MMVKKDVFDKVNGFEEAYKGELGKVDLCLKIRNKHRSVVYNPYVEVVRWSNELRNNENDEKLFKKKVDRNIGKREILIITRICH